jgi:hypothetical protein
MSSGIIWFKFPTFSPCLPNYIKVYWPVVDKPEKIEIMAPEEVAQYLGKSQTWVYNHWRVLGGGMEVLCSSPGRGPL